MQAFPGAYGWGAESIGGHGGRVIKITNLNNGGPGSFRDAVQEQSGPRIVVPRVAGDIFLRGSRIKIRNPFLSYAGQTAPGGGITLRSQDERVRPLINFEEDVTDVILRYLKVRPGRAHGIERDGITFRSGSRIMLDHLSVQWATDELVSINPDAPGIVTDVTIQNSILGACLRPHSTALALSSSNEIDEIRRISLHHNLFVHNAHRNPRFTSSKQLEFVNNIVYNWHARAGKQAGQVEADFIGNLLIPGPWSNPNRFWEYEDDRPGPPLFYTEDNLTPDQTNAWGNTDSSFFSSVRLADGATFPTPIDPADQLPNKVLAGVGDSIRLNAEGLRVNKRDRIDAQMVRDVLNGTGPTIEQENDDPSDYGGYPIIDPGTTFSIPTIDLEDFLNGEEKVSVITDLEAIETKLRELAQLAPDLIAQADAIAQTITDLRAADDALDAAADVIEED